MIIVGENLPSSLISPVPIRFFVENTQRWFDHNLFSTFIATLAGAIIPLIFLYISSKIKSKNDTKKILTNIYYEIGINIQLQDEDVSAVTNDLFTYFDGIANKGSPVVSRYELKYFGTQFREYFNVFFKELAVVESKTLRRIFWFYKNIERQQKIFDEIRSRLLEINSSKDINAIKDVFTLSNVLKDSIIRIRLTGYEALAFITSNYNIHDEIFKGTITTEHEQRTNAYLDLIAIGNKLKLTDFVNHTNMHPLDAVFSLLKNKRIETTPNPGIFKKLS